MAANRSSNATVPAHGAVAVTPSNDSIIPVTRALYVGTAGNLAVRMADGTYSPVFVSVPIGIFPIQVDQVLESDTTALNIVALY